MDDLRACVAMMDFFISRISAASTPHEHDASTKGELAATEEKLCDMSGANFERPASAGSRRRCSRPSCTSTL